MAQAKHQQGDRFQAEVKVLRALDDGRYEVEVGTLQATVGPEFFANHTKTKGAKHADDAEDLPSAKAAKK